jgi:hypothetical protein
MQQRARTVGRYHCKKDYGLPLWRALSVVVLIAGLGFTASTFLLSGAPGFDDWLVGEQTHTRGSSSAPVSVVFFGDFQCVECAADQGKSWEYQELIYRWQGAPNSERLSHELLRQLGLGIRLDSSDFRTWMQHGFTAGQVMDDLRFAEALGVSARRCTSTACASMIRPTMGSFACTSSALPSLSKPSSRGTVSVEWPHLAGEVPNVC